MSPRPSRAVAFAALVAAHTERLCHFVYRFVGSRDVAEDIVQEVFVAIWERGGAWDAADPLPYLYKAARNRAVSYARQLEVRERFAASSGSVEAAEAGGSESGLEEAELAAAVSRAVEQLPEKCRLVFTMSREQGLSHLQIAEVLGLSVKTVESHIWRALVALRGSLAPYLGVLVLMVR